MLLYTVVTLHCGNSLGKCPQVHRQKLCIQSSVESNLMRVEAVIIADKCIASDATSLSLALFTPSPERRFKYPSSTIDFNFCLPKLTFLVFFCVPAETEPHEGKRKVESLWPIFRLHHQRSRYIFDLFYKRKAISRGKQNSPSSFSSRLSFQT